MPIGAAFPLAVFGGICLTDFVDGRIARAWGAVSRTGAYLDLYCDLFYIAASLTVLNLLGQVSVWFTSIVFVKSIEYLITSRILCRGDGSFVSDPLGRAAAGLFFIIPGLVCALYRVWGGSLLIDCILYLAAALALLSFITRSMSCIRIVKGGVIHEH